MAHEALAVTATLAAAGRAVESRRTDRLFEDPLAAGRGVDTRAFRLPVPAEVIVFELDLPELLESKQAILEREHARVRTLEHH